MSVEGSVLKSHKDHHDIRTKAYRDQDAKSKRKRQTREDSQLIEHSPNKKFRTSRSHNASGTVVVLDSDLESVEYSSFHLQTYSLYLPLSPICQLYPLEGLCAEHLSPLILNYYPPFQGVILSYSDVRLSEEPESNLTEGNHIRVLAKSIDEYAVSFVWVTATFLLFKPQKQRWIEGWINLQSESHLGLVCWNLFNASIERKRLPQDWKWVPGESNSTSMAKLKLSQGDLPMEGNLNGDTSEQITNSSQGGEGYFEDSSGAKLEGSIRFRVKDVETSSSIDKEKSFLSIEGTLLNLEEEVVLIDDEKTLSQDRPKGFFAEAGFARYSMSGALVGNHDKRLDSTIPTVKSSNHRVTY
ncbi:hypothetical protein MMC19_003099 [Ptychographa xylographoides]|nr:hypothetical protein [Ptychographa xylographoides]